MRRHGLVSVGVFLVAALLLALSGSIAMAHYDAGLSFRGDDFAVFPDIGGGYFAAARPIVADMNGDGIPDIVACDAHTAGMSGVGIAYGEGWRRFSPVTTVPLSVSVGKVCAGDLNGDGRLDLVAKNWAVGVYVWVLLQQPGGTFSTATTLTQSFGAADVMLEDVNGDGHLDLLDAGSTRVSARLGDGAGGFGPEISSSVAASGQMYSMDTADADGDGDLDMAVVDGVNHQLRVLDGDGAGHFSVAATAALTGDTTSSLGDLAFVDLDADAHPEIVVSSYSSQKLMTFDGTGLAYAQVSSIPLGCPPNQIERADFDQDGHDDIALVCNGGGIVAIFDSDGTGTLIQRYHWDTPDSLYGWPLGVGDADGDGRIDVLGAWNDGMDGYVHIGHNVVGAEVRRVSGPDRYRTAAAGSASAFRYASTVVIATGEDFPDALSGSGLAGAVHGPLLLVRHDSLPASVTAEIVRLHAKKAYVLGSDRSVSNSVAAALSRPPCSLAVTRLEGENRYATARRIAQEIRNLSGTSIGTVFVARGDKFADALAAAPLAWATGSPVVLVKPPSSRRELIGGDAGLAIWEIGATKAVVCGSEKAVSEATAHQLPVATLVRVEGPDRYGTALALAKYGVTEGIASWRYLCVATGLDFPDGLSGGAAAGSRHGLLLLTPTASLAPTLTPALSANSDSIWEVHVLGGESAVGSTAFNSIVDAVQ